MSSKNVQEIADEAAEKVSALSDVEEDIEVTIVESPPGGATSGATYRAVRTETGLGVGDWSGAVQTGDVLTADTHPQYVLDALLASDVIVEEGGE